MGPSTRTLLRLLPALALLTGCAGLSAPTAEPSKTPAPVTTVASTSTPNQSVPGQIVFSDFGGAHKQIYIKSLDASPARRLVTSEYDDLAPSFSPDGSHVVFSRLDNLDTDDGIFIVDVDGSNLRQLMPDNCPGRCGDSVERRAFSADGTKIVFTRGLFDPGSPAPFNVGLWVADADGANAHQITLQGAECRDVCPGGAQDNQATWSPDGNRIAFMRDEYTSPERYALFTVAADGSDLQQVTSWELNGADPDWSPDGSRILFISPGESYATGPQNIFTIQPDGTGLTQLTDGLSAYPDGKQGTNNPSWSPDGTQIIFTHYPSDSQGTSDLFVMSADGSDLHVLSKTLLVENQPFWWAPTNPSATPTP